MLRQAIIYCEVNLKRKKYGLYIKWIYKGISTDNIFE
jgi:hypothetical protein